MGTIEPLPDGDALPVEGIHMIFEFNPHNGRLTQHGDIYSSSPFNRREAFEAAQVAVEQCAALGDAHKYIVAS